MTTKQNNVEAIRAGKAKKKNKKTEEEEQEEKNLDLLYIFTCAFIRLYFSVLFAPFSIRFFFRLAVCAMSLA